MKISALLLGTISPLPSSFGPRPPMDRQWDDNDDNERYNIGFAPRNINRQSWINVNTKVSIDIDINAYNS